MLYILRLHATVLSNVLHTKNNIQDKTTTLSVKDTDTSVISSLISMNEGYINNIYAVLQKGYSSDPLLIHLPDWYVEIY